jgi:two-component sensor histidine kinase
VNGARSEITEQRMLLIELAHRSKNLLAIIQSIANQTAANSRSIEEFQHRFQERVQALARIHDVLSSESWRGATIPRLIRSVVLPLIDTADERIEDAAGIEYRGEEIFLAPNAAQHVGLAFHELAVLAVERRARVGLDDAIRITWARSQLPECARSGDVVLVWEETGPSSTPAAAGDFGRVILEEIVPAAVNGRAALRMDHGIHYRLTIPATELSRFAVPETH